MKYGKEFQQILDASDFPDDWKTSAIEYRKLKKLIKNVVAELEGMGLPPSVLHKLLETPAPGSSGGGSGGSTDIVTPDGGIFEFEFEDASPRAHASPKEVQLDPVLDDDAPLRRFRLRMVSEPQSVGSIGSLSGSLGANGLEGTSPQPVSVADLLRQNGDGSLAQSTTPRRRDSSLSPAPVGRVLKADTENGGVKAQYVLAGDEARPVPQIRLQMSAVETPLRSLSQSTLETLDTLDTSEATDTEDEQEDLDRLGASTSRGRAGRAPDEDANEPAVPPSPALLKMRSAASPIWALAGRKSDGMKDLSLGEAAAPARGRLPSRIGRGAGSAVAPVKPMSPMALVSGRPSANGAGGEATPTMRSVLAPAPSAIELDSAATQLADVIELDAGTKVGTYGTSTPGSPSASPSEREFIIPLQSDMRFFEVLTAALTSLSEFHAAQQAKFTADVEALCAAVSQSIAPGDGVLVYPTPLNSHPDAPSVQYEYRGAKPSQRDLYVWREIFSMWVEAEIFESNAERDRGERTVDEAERRLEKFASDVVRKGLGDRRTIKGRKSRKAWDEFLRLNVLLLDLKRFQMANIDAARKILKKHDKRTALTASTGLAAFVRSTLATAHVDTDGNVSTWTFYNTSLPHVLLASLTNTLLPILPSLDDYACLICMSIAFKPIRLTCGHLFCVRCLVKMQQRYKENCPLCRSESVLLADKTCLDVQLMNFMKDWFPKEVREKQRESAAEIAKENLQDVDPRCVVQ